MTLPNLPNGLTLSRIFLVPILVVVLLTRTERWELIGAAIFAVAALTDWLDGYLARKLNLGSTLGRNLDPLVDKVVVCGAYIFLLHHDESGLTPWMIVIVVSRELIITGLRSFLENLGANFGAEWLGKIKMVLQCAALFAIFLALYDANIVFTWARDILVWAMLVATALSGLQYLWKAFALLNKNS